MTPQTRYARSGNVSIAYQVLGGGAHDIVFVPGFVSHLEIAWEEPGFRRLLERLASFSRLMLFDKRGTGLSDRVAVDALPTLEERMDDVRAVMDAVGSERATLLGVSEGGPMSILFATTYPQRTAGLILYGSYARRVRTDDYPWAPPIEEHVAFLARMESEWGGPAALDTWAPSRATDLRFARWWAQFLRLGASPGSARALLEMTLEIDVRDILPAIRVPTLVLHRAGDRRIDPGGSLYLAESIPGAIHRELPGEDHLAWVGDVDRLADEVEEFVTGTHHERAADRVLATVLFTDIVGSTARAAEIGDRAWQDLLTAHHSAVRAELARFGGREIDTAGDGFFAAFDGPARAVLCACAVRERVSQLGLQLRQGMHTGECEVQGESLAGIAVHIGARVASAAAPGEILVTSTVRDLVAGSGLIFTAVGARQLKGVPDEWLLFATAC